MTQDLFSHLFGGLIVSCQALEDEPLHGADTMMKMAQAAELAGAVGIRANGAADVKAIRAHTHLPVIGLIKREYADSEIYITATRREVDELIEAGATMIAIDGTCRPRPQGETLEGLVSYMKLRGVPVMADISTFEEAKYAEEIGVDCVSTTMSGYTSYSSQQEDPDIKLVKEASEALRIPVIAEGRIWHPDQAAGALKAGAFAVVVGSAITRPQLIAERYVQAIRKVEPKHGYEIPHS
ncbi:N-acetylmannosamine-6-phosphate 2-epimerase [Paenibacillus roseipurpureus]|uniref:Putative N-acetylmannosamine-6-phosphate 2-epimerase n=1 Tax=Paenibacillus roseopurpureus TaxID=2918901 RepID=A0AA96RLX2_9BACL|nr:N-acetylmannosamine-6-phosphate 2-epimerase [Paenibacillus sp. MBLB1832]WNR46130.1 N-acetylmannosamine-6-phosphate 2-epimerase [Paenibacillus sp. MBLB1832]